MGINISNIKELGTFLLTSKKSCYEKKEEKEENQGFYKPLLSNTRNKICQVIMLLTLLWFFIQCNKGFLFM